MFEKSKSLNSFYNRLTDHLAEIFNLNNSNKLSLSIQSIYEFENLKGVIINIQNNGRGNSSSTEIVVSKFFNTKRLYLFSQYRYYQNYIDFTELFPTYTEPDSKTQYLTTAAFFNGQLLTYESSDNLIYKLSAGKYYSSGKEKYKGPRYSRI